MSQFTTTEPKPKQKKHRKYSLMDIDL